MDNFGSWFNAAFNELKLRWQAHLVPSAIFMGVTLFIVMIAMTGMGILGVVASLIDERAVPFVMFGGWGLLMLVMMFGTGPLLVGYYRYALKTMRGEPAALGDLFAKDAIFSSLLTNGLVLGATMTAAMFCYLPAFPVSALLLFAMPALADNPGMNPIDAIKRSFELARPVLVELMLYWFLAAMLATMLAYIPVIGMFLVLPAMTAFILTPYLHLNDGVLPGQTFLEDGEREAVSYSAVDPESPYRPPAQL